MHLQPFMIDTDVPPYIQMFIKTVDFGKTNQPIKKEAIAPRMSIIK